jgi:hypothetical protein
MESRRVLPLEVHFNEEACQIVLDIDSTLEKEYAKRIERYKLSDGVRDMSTCQSNSASDAENLVSLVRAEKMSWVGIGWLLFSPSFVCAAQSRGMSAVEYADWLYQQCEELNKNVRYRAAWMEAYGEIGNSLVWPEGQKFSKRDALNYFRKWFTTGQSHCEHWHRIVDPNVLSFYSHAKQKNPNFRELPLYYTDGTLFALQEAFRAGFPMVVYEGGAGTLNPVQMGVANVRGGAKMFDTFWGVDLSPWTYGPLGTVASTNNNGGWIEGLTPDAFFRIWLSVYLSGVNMFLHEVGHCFFYTQSQTGELALSDYGYRAMQFYRLKNDLLAERGSLVAPFAIVLEEEHGYRGDMIREITPDGEFKIIRDVKTPDDRLLIWQNHVSEVTRGDWQVYRTLSTLWPLPDNGWKKLMADWPDHPFIDHNPETDPELTAMIKAGFRDPRDYAKCVADSLFADCFDIISEDVSGERMSQYYKVLLLTGAIKTDGELAEKFSAFAENGGTVVMSLDQADDRLLKRSGMTIEESQAVHVASAEIKDKRVIDVDETLLLNRVCVESNKVTVWASDKSTGKPLVLRVEMGKGHVYVILFAYGMDREAKKISAIYRELIDTLYGEYVGVYRNGPACQMIINRRSDDTLVTLLNHTCRDWVGEVALKRSLYSPVEEVCELMVDEAYPASLISSDEQEVRVKLRVPACETKILSFGRKRSPHAKRGIHCGLSGQSEDIKKFREEILKKGPATVIGTL